MDRDTAVDLGHLAGSVVGALALTLALLTVGEAAHLPFINGWAFFHGSLLLVVPACWLLAYVFLIPVFSRLRSRATGGRSSSLPVLAFICVVVGGVLPLGSVPGLLLGYRARRRCREDPTLPNAKIAELAIVFGWLVNTIWVLGLAACIVFL